VVDLTAILALPACGANISEPQGPDNPVRRTSDAPIGPLNLERGGDDATSMTVALIAVGVEVFGLACGVALARAAAVDDK
jgi:hypothetical protein